MEAQKGKTWEEECLPHLRIRNAHGDVTLCVLWNLLDTVMPTVEAMVANHRISVVGNLRTPLGINWFMRGLGKLPRITTVVLWGSDLTRTGEALIELLRSGATERHSIPSFEWTLDPLIESKFIHELKDGVYVVDWRGKSLNDLDEYLGHFQWKHKNRSSKTFPPMLVPELREFKPRSAPILLHATDPADGWLQALNAVMRCGVRKNTRKKESIANYFEIAVSFPALEIETIDECFDFNKADLDVYCAEMLSPDPPPEGIDYRYGQRLQNWRGHNQLDEAINRLVENIDTKRGTVAVLDPTDLEEREDAPCLNQITFAVVDGKLNMSVIFRSHDMYAGWPQNIMALLRVYRMVIERLKDKGVGCGRFTVLSQNAQIYERHFAFAEKKLSEHWITLENINSKAAFTPDPAGAFVFVIDEKTGKVKATMKNSLGDANLLEAEHHSPSALIKWIIATMPWLDAQHIRYLGIQEAKLLLALKEKIPYRQD